MATEYQWDESKAASNFLKHGVTFEEALSVFDNPLAAIFDDEDHSGGDSREIIVGHSIQDRLLLVCFSERSGTVRMISARPATAKERKDYEEGVLNS
jgi:uncharacterized DUF497 family protein